MIIESPIKTTAGAPSKRTPAASLNTSANSTGTTAAHQSSRMPGLIPIQVWLQVALRELLEREAAR